MLSLSEGRFILFAPAGDGMEPAWSHSIQAPADPLEPHSSPEMRRHSADLLFRSHSSPADKMTIELCCWNSKGWARTFQDVKREPELRPRDKESKQKR